MKPLCKITVHDLERMEVRTTTEDADRWHTRISETLWAVSNGTHTWLYGRWQMQRAIDMELK